MQFSDGMIRGMRMNDLRQILADNKEAVPAGRNKQPFVDAVIAYRDRLNAAAANNNGNVVPPILPVQAQPVAQQGQQAQNMPFPMPQFAVPQDLQQQVLQPQPNPMGQQANPMGQQQLDPMVQPAPAPTNANALMDRLTNVVAQLEEKQNVQGGVQQVFPHNMFPHQVSGSGPCNVK